MDSLNNTVRKPQIKTNIVLPDETYNGPDPLPNYPIEEQEDALFFTPENKNEEQLHNPNLPEILTGFTNLSIGKVYTYKGPQADLEAKETHLHENKDERPTRTNLKDQGTVHSKPINTSKVEKTIEIPRLDLTPKKSVTDIDQWIARLLKCQPLNEDEIEQLCSLLVDNLSHQENCINIYSPLTVVGDIHGQLHDLLELFRIRGLPPHTNYLFLGDYVDRGFFSCETFCLIASFRIRFPSKVYILRGNHESRQTTQIYGFYDECLRKYGSPKIWNILTAAFDVLPISATIDNKIFCDHGGISNETLNLSQVRELNRVQEIPQCGCMCDLLWSDPATPEDDQLTNGWRPSPRGAGVIFSQEITEKFLHQNDLQFICRAHQLAEFGYVCQHDNKVITVFSAPNYCYRCGNLASVMNVDEMMNKEFVSFNTAPLRAMPEKIRFSPDYFL